LHFKRLACSIRESFGLKVYFYADNGRAKRAPELKRAVNMAAGAFAAEGIPVERVGG